MESLKPVTGSHPTRASAPVRIPLWVAWVVGGVATIGSLLGLINDAAQFFTLSRAVAFSIAVGLCWVVLEVLAWRRGIIIGEQDGEDLVTRSLGAQIRIPLVVGIGVGWAAIWLKPVASIEKPFELGSTYRSNFAALLFDESGAPLKSVLSLKNISQSTLLDISARVHKVTVVAAELRFIKPYLPPSQKAGYYTGYDNGILPPTGTKTPFLQPNETFDIEISGMVKPEEREMLLTYDGGDVSALRKRSLANVKLGLGPTTKQAEELSVSFAGPTPQKGFGSPSIEHSGVLFWIEVSYRHREQLNSLLYFGGYARGFLVPGNGEPIVPMGGAHDFMVRLPFAYGARDGASDSERIEVLAPLKTVEDLASPSRPGTFISATEDERFWIAPFFALDETSSARAACPPDPSDPDGLPRESLAWRKRRGKLPGGSLKFDDRGADLSFDGRRARIPLKVLYEGPVAGVKLTFLTTDVAGNTGVLSVFPEGCKLTEHMLSAESLASQGVDVAKVARVDYQLEGLKDGAEGFLYLWSQKIASL